MQKMPLVQMIHISGQLLNQYKKIKAFSVAALKASQQTNPVSF
jgi:hypothetical protein